MEVRKSEGYFEEYNPSKVKHGICEAYTAVKETCPDGLIESLIDNLFIYDKISSSEIRRQVEEALMSVNKKVAREYIKKFEEKQDKDKTLKKDNTCNEIRYSLHVYYYFIFYKSYSIPENISIFAQIIF